MNVARSDTLSWADKRRAAIDEACRGNMKDSRRALWRLAQEASSGATRAIVMGDLASITANEGQIAAARTGWLPALAIDSATRAAQYNLSMIELVQGNKRLRLGEGMPTRIALLSLLSIGHRRVEGAFTRKN